MDEPPDLETRVTSLEERMEEVAADAAAARHLAAASDRDLADLGVKVDANRTAINALGLQLNGRFTGVEGRLDGVQGRLDGVEGRLDGVEGRLTGVEGRLTGVEGRLGSLEERVDSGFAEVGVAFAEMRGKFDATATGQQAIVDLLTTLIDDGGRPPTS